MNKVQSQAQRLMELLQEKEGWGYDKAWCAVFLNGRVEIQGQVIDVQVDDEELAAQIDALAEETRQAQAELPAEDEDDDGPWMSEWEARNQFTGRQDGQ